jgi:predicted HTH transcriptional regulator
MYDEKWLINAIKQGENEFQDFKQTIPSSEKIAKTIGAFSNANGGRLIIGVKDNGKVLGVSITEEAYMIEAAYEKFLKNVIPLKLHIINHENKKVLVVEIYPNEHAVALAYSSEKNKWLAYTRFKDKTVLLGFIGYKFLVESKQNGLLSTFDINEKRITSYISKKSPTKSITLNEVKKNLKITRNQSIIAILNLLKLGILKLDYSYDEERFLLVE